jgi:O-antigen/teichoic acid export membrane protein
MLVGQTAINFAANVISAAFGLVNVMIFTRLFAPAEFGTYVLGTGFAAIASTFMTSWLRLPIMSKQARGDGTDVRGIVAPGLVLSCALAPLAYIGTLLAGLASGPALAAAGLALSIGFFETSQELLRARLQAFTAMKALVLLAFTLVGHAGVFLLTSTALAYLLATLAFTRDAWVGTTIRCDGARLLSLAKAGIPLTVSLTLLALSGVIDRFIIAHVSGPAFAGQFAAGTDLARQVLCIPAVSAAGAFFPLAVRMHANRGQDAVRSYLEECFEFLLAIVLPACVGFAIVSPHIANVILGPDFRQMAVTVMPIVSVALIFQIISYQYLHISFLLSERNSFFLLNTGSALAINVVVSYLLIQRFGAVGAAWGRLAAEIFGCGGALLLTQWAFPMPVPYQRLTRVVIAAIVMAIMVRSLELLLVPTDRDALVMLLPGGIVTYLAMCWLLDIAKSRYRMRRGLLIVRKALAG